VVTLKKKLRGSIMNTEWLSVEDIANELNVHPDTVRGWIRTRQLKAFKFGRDYRVKREDYIKFVNARATTGDDNYTKN
jgi:excisionase family DNA binding protein